MTFPLCQRCATEHNPYAACPDLAVTNTRPDVTNPVANTASARVSRWSAAHLDRYRAYQRELMRQRRAPKVRVHG